MADVAVDDVSAYLAEADAAALADAIAAAVTPEDLDVALAAYRDKADGHWGTVPPLPH